MGLSLLSCNYLTKSYGIESILNNINFQIHPRDRVGVVGNNGAGKSTLFRIIAGIEAPDSGSVNVIGDTAIGFLSQHPEFESNTSIWDNLVKDFSHLTRMEQRIKKLEADMSAKNGDMLIRLMKEYGDITEKFAKIGGYEYKSQIRGALRGLGIQDHQFDMFPDKLSGGQQTRAALAGLLLRKYHLLLLDEPTNYLDIQAVEWLEDFLSEYDGAVMIISHDRYFLDGVCTRIFELRDSSLYEFDGNYSDYVYRKHIMQETKARHYMNRQREIKRQQEIIRRLKSYNRQKTVKRANSREKLLSRMQPLEKPEQDAKTVNIRLNPLVKSGREVLTLDDVSMTFDENRLFENVNLKVYRGETIGIIGPNGIGKTTLFNIISGRLKPTAGRALKGHNVNIEYYHQQQENINPANTVLDEIRGENPDLGSTETRNILAAFLFSGDDVNKRIDSLSGGEKSRVALAKLMLSRSNLLLLDEPTNHLDIQSREVLEDALTDYTGTVLVISHDRYFLDRVTTKTALLTPQGIELYFGNYSYYRMKKQQQESMEEESRENIMTRTAVKHQKRMERKEREARKQKQEKIQRLEQKITGVEEEILRLEHQMCRPEVYSDPGKIKKLNMTLKQLREELELLYKQWEEAVE
jgi:ATP-binding cassette subfamily F protein 3